MTEIRNHTKKTLYDDDRNKFEISIDTTVDAISHSDTGEGAMVSNRLRDAIEKEIQAMQDQLDEEGTVTHTHD